MHGASADIKDKIRALFIREGKLFYTAAKKNYNINY